MTADTQITIFIDNKPYLVPQDTVAPGGRLRALPNPDIGPEYDLWLDVEGTDNDKKIGNTDEVQLVANMHFYTAPADLNPGA